MYSKNEHIWCSNKLFLVLSSTYILIVLFYRAKSSKVIQVNNYLISFKERIAMNFYEGF